jgi:hypothetical protein
MRRTGDLEVLRPVDLDAVSDRRSDLDALAAVHCHSTVVLHTGLLWLDTSWHWFGQPDGRGWSAADGEPVIAKTPSCSSSSPAAVSRSAATCSAELRRASRARSSLGQRPCSPGTHRELPSGRARPCARALSGLGRRAKVGICTAKSSKLNLRWREGHRSVEHRRGRDCRRT